MRTHTARLARAYLLAAIAVTAWGCATVQTNPTEESVAATREAALRVSEGVRTGIAIVREVGAFVDTLPLPAEQKDGYDSAVIAATGTTAAPGPLYRALDTLRTVATVPSLRATVGEVIEAVDPLITKLETSGNRALVGFGAVLRAALAYAYSITAGGAL